MAAHSRLKNEFTEGEKYHNLMSWLILGNQDFDFGNRGTEQFISGEREQVSPYKAVTSTRVPNVWVGKTSNPGTNLLPVTRKLILEYINNKEFQVNRAKFNVTACINALHFAKSLLYTITWILLQFRTLPMHMCAKDRQTDWHYLLFSFKCIFSNYGHALNAMVRVPGYPQVIETRVPEYKISTRPSPTPWEGLTDIQEG